MNRSGPAREGKGVDSTTIPAPVTGATRALAALLLVAGLAHVPPTGHHLAESPAVGAAFVGFTAACVLLLAALPGHPAPAVLAATALLCGAAVVAYVASRLVPLPGLEHDVGRWLDPYGAVAVAAEVAAAVTALRLLRAARG